MRMEIKKSWISYVWWFLFAVYTIFLMAQAAGQVSDYLPVNKVVLIRTGLIGLSLIIAVICGGMVYAISRSCGKKQFGKGFFVGAEIGFWVLAVALFVLRFLYRMVPAEGGRAPLLGNALVQSGETGRGMLSGVSSLYVDTLSVFFSFLGNKAEIVFYLQFILQILTIVMIYFALRMLCGRIVAFSAGLLLICSDEWIKAVMMFEPEVFFMFLWSLLLLILSIFYSKTRAGKWQSKKIQIIGSLLIGGMCGILLYYDILGILLPVIAIYLFYIAEKTQKIISVWAKAAIFLGGFIAGSFIMLFREAIVKSSTVVENLQRWCSQYPLRIQFSVVWPMENMGVLAVILIFSVFLIAAFWLNVKPEMSVWAIIMLVLCVVGPIFGMTALNQQMWVTLVWSVLAGSGLQGLVRAGLNAGSKVDSKVSMEAGDTEKAGGKGWEKVEKAGETAAVAAVSEETSRYDTSTGIKYIENPLPLPPKPVKKGMDFPFKVPVEKMYYDVNVADDADYDLKV